MPTTYAYDADISYDAAVLYDVTPPQLTVNVEIAFSSNPFGTPVYTDVTTYVAKVSIEDGRDSEFELDFAAGTCTLTLDNSDRRFEPEYAASPYYPNVVPMRKMRVTATWSGVVYPLFVGYIERWPLDYHAGSEVVEIEVTATDGFLALAQAELESVYFKEVMADSPRAYYRLGGLERDAGTALDSSGNMRHGRFEGGPGMRAAQSVIAADDDGAVEFSDSPSPQRVYTRHNLIPTYPFTIEVWVRLDNQNRPAGRYVVGQFDNRGLDDGPFLFIGSAGQVHFGAVKGKVSRSVRSNKVVDDNGPHHLVGVAVNSTTFRLYVDGVLDSVLGVAGAPSGWGSGAMTIGNADHSTGSYPLQGTADEVAIYSTALSATRIAAHYDAGWHPWGNRPSGTVINNVLDQIGWPAGDREIDAGNSLIGAINLAGESALSILQRINRTETGALHMTGDGKVRFRERHAALRTPLTTSQATFSTNPGAGEFYASNIKPSYSVDLVRNHITRGRQGGSAYTANDSASQTKYGGKRSDSQTDLVMEDANEAVDNAVWTLERRKEVTYRFDALTTEPYGDEAALLPQILGRKIGDRITVKYEPPGGAGVVTKQCHIEGRRLVITGEGEVSVSWPLSVAVDRTYWRLGLSALGSQTRLAF